MEAPVATILATLQEEDGLSYSPLAGFQGIDELAINLSDLGGFGDDPSIHGLPQTGGDDYEEASLSMDVIVNGTPQASDNLIEPQQDTTYTFAAAAFPFFDPGLR